MKRWTMPLVMLVFAAVLAISGSPGKAQGANAGYRIFILNDDALLSEDAQAPVDIGGLKAFYEDDGHTVTLVDGAQLSSNASFNADLCDLLVLPYGPKFPLESIPNFKAYMAAGGKLITLGGYAFSRLNENNANHALSVSAAAPAEAHWRTTVDPAKFAQRTQLKLSVWMKTDDVSGSGGYAHSSVYIYDGNGNMLSWNDFKKSTGKNGWARYENDFSVPAGAASIQINLGLFQAKGTVRFDRVLLTDASGDVVLLYDDFEEGIPAHWQPVKYAGSAVLELTAADVPAQLEGSNHSLSLSAATKSSAQWSVSFDPYRLAPNTDYKLSLWMKTHQVDVGGYAFAALYFYDASGARLGWKDLRQAKKTTDWFKQEYMFQVPAGTARVDLNLGLSGTSGIAYFDKVKLTNASGTEVIYADDFEETEPERNWRRVTFGGSPVFGLSGEAPVETSQPVFLGSDRPSYVGDQALYDSSSIPIFDMEHALRNVAVIEPAMDQKIFAGNLSLTAPVEGYSAVTVTGNNRGRWQPLITAKDKNGETRGTIGAIMRLFPEPDERYALENINEWHDYPGASIAFFGVTNRNLLDPANTALRAGFRKLTEALVRDVYIETVANRWDNYKQGESPQMTAYIGNGGKGPVSGMVRFEVITEDTGQLVYSQDVPYSVNAKKHAAVTATWNTPAFTDDFYTVRTILKDAAGNDIDQFTNCFSIWDQAVVDAGPHISYTDNYLQIKRPDNTVKTIFAAGSDDGANLPLAMDQTALQWKIDMKQHLDAGMSIYELLQQYPAFSPWSDIFDDPDTKEAYLRRVDHIVYLSQKYKQIYKMGLAIGNDVGAADAELEQTAGFIEEMAARYKDVPGLIYYLNGDMRSTLTEKLLPIWRSFLQTRYVSVAKLNIAWKTNYASFSQVPLEGNYPDAGIDPQDANGYGLWGDRKAYDYNTFKTALVTRWTERLIEAIRAGDPTHDNHPIVCEFYRWPAYGFDISTAIGNLTYSNVGNFELHYTFPEQLQYADLRAIGKSFGVGEFGKRTHPLFSNVEYETIASTSYEEARNNFFGYMSMGFAMGANHMQTWSWADESRFVFPWGMRFTGDRVGRDLLYWFRNMNLFTRQVEPVYEPAQVAVIQPDRSRMSGGTFGIAAHWASVNAFDILQSAHVTQIRTLNENVLENDPNEPIDPAIKVIFYPVPYNPGDIVYNKLKAWVQAGGVLYLSGDISYDENYERTKGQRLIELAGATSAAPTVYYTGLNWHKAPYAPKYYAYDPAAPDKGRSTMTPYIVKPNLEVAFGANVTVLYRDENDNPVIVQNDVGAGKVVYSTVPVEIFYNSGIFNSDPSTLEHDVALYRKVLDLAGIGTTTVLEPDRSRVKMFELPLKNGAGRIYTVTNVSPSADYIGTVNGRFRHELGGGYSDMVWVDGSGHLKGIFNRGVVKDNNVTIADNAPYAFVFAKDAAKLTDSKQVTILPQQPGHFKLKNDASWTNMRVVSGQVEDGAWIENDEMQASAAGGFIEFDVGSEQANKIILIVEQSQYNALKTAIVADLTDISR
ncbi:beta-galactosidase [Paenibacillus sp. GCM10027626]|uniref:beta-galactosidase n=1 Tax=Paenibacillus sp. GCM10027626 TaxID=3273411 RepID=UPI003633F9EF